MTLIELMMAVVLLSLVMTTAVSMELGLRRMFRSTDLEIQLLAEASPILSMITKDINRGIGYPGQPAFWYQNLGDIDAFNIRHDFNSNAQADDGPVTYNYHRSGADQYLLEYCVGSACEILSRRVTLFSITDPYPYPHNGFSDITVQLTRDPTDNASSTNPQLTLQSSAQYRASSFDLQ